MSQSRFSIVLVGVSALLRRPLVSRLRPADGERSSWVVFAARGCRWASSFFRLPLRRLPSAGWPSGSLLPLFGTHRFGVALGGLVLPLVGLVFPPSASEIALGGLAFGLIASELPFGGLAFGFTASAFRHAPFRGCPRRVGLRAHCFRFSACTASELPLGELAFGLLLRKLPSAG